MSTSLFSSTTASSAISSVITSATQYGGRSYTNWVLPLSKVPNTETIGYSCEQAHAKNNGIDVIGVEDRHDPVLTLALQGLFKTPLKNFKITEAIGTKNGPYDFIGEGPDNQQGATISMKSNYSGDKVAPQRIGQATKKRFMEHFNIPTSADPEISQNDTIKTYILENIATMLPEYLKHLNCCDWIIYIDGQINKKDKSPCLGTVTDEFIYWCQEKGYQISPVTYTVKNVRWFHKTFLEDLRFQPSKFTFTKPTVAEWNESTTVKYNSISIGEFQIHNNRDCVKFRFHFKNLLHIADTRIVCQDFQIETNKS